jgi:hypothetical protein
LNSIIGRVLNSRLSKCTPSQPIVVTVTHPSLIPVLLLVSAFPLCGTPADDIKANVSSSECAGISEHYLAKRLGLWQQRLKLDDWNILIVMSRAEELKPNTIGNIHWEIGTKSATLRVLDASGYALRCPDMLNDMEFTIVHELIHLAIHSVFSAEFDLHAEEAAVNRISEALLNLDRHKVATRQRHEDAGAARN